MLLRIQLTPNEDDCRHCPALFNFLTALYCTFVNLMHCDIFVCGLLKISFIWCCQRGQSHCNSCCRIHMINAGTAAADPHTKPSDRASPL